LSYTRVEEGDAFIKKKNKFSADESWIENQAFFVVVVGVFCVE
jgi:hypothetical protein